MGTIAAGLASSHAFTLLDPETWDERRAWNRGAYKRRYGVEPTQQPQVDQETLETIRPRYQRVRSGLERLRDELARMRADALLVVGDDQDENYNEQNMPQFAIYTGERIRAVAHGEDGGEYACHSELAESILEGCVAQGFDLAYSRQFPNGELKSHAHGPPLHILTPERNIPIVPIFVNAIHMPAPEPPRCYAFGQAIARVIESRPAGEKVAVYASGGLSHFTAGYPWKHYKGPNTHGAICTDFDRSAVDLMRQGKASKLAELTSGDLLANGEIELRSWLIMLGAIGDQPRRISSTSPFTRPLWAWPLVSGKMARSSRRSFVMPNNVRHPRPGVRIPRCARNDKGWLLLSILGGALLMASCGGSAAVPAASSAAASSRSAAPVASATASAAAKPSAAGETTKLNVAYSNPTPIITPAWVARDAGIFNKNGLDVNLLLIAGGAVTTAALVSGQIDFALAGGSEALSAAAGGADLLIVGTQVPVWPFVLIAAPEIKTLGDLKGKKVAIVTNGGSVDIAMRAALPKLGVTPDTDFTVIATGSSPNIVTALLSGAVQAGMVGTPDNVLLQEKGFRALLDLATSKIPGATSGIVAQRAHVAAHKDATQKLVDSLVEGTVKVHKDKAFAIATLKKELKSEDDRAMGIAYDFYIGSGAMPVLPYPKPEQFADAQNVLGAKNENIRKVDLGKLLDDSFVKSAAQRGLDR